MKILIVRVGALGDVLHGMPAVAALRTALPDAEIAWAIEPRWSPLLAAPGATAATAAMPLVEAVHPVPAKEWSRSPLSFTTLRSVRSLRRVLRGARYDIAIDLQGSIRSAVIARMSGARRVIGSFTPRERPARLFYTERVSLHSAHVIDQATEIVSAAAGFPLRPVAAPLPIDPTAESWCDALAINWRETIFLAPTAGWPAKQWPAPRFAELAEACSRAGFRALVNQAGPQDTVAAEVVRLAGGCAEAVDCSVAQMIALLRRVSLVVAGDTGPLHLAAALGTPVVGLYGPTDPARNGPWGAPARVLRRAGSITDHHRYKQTEAGLASITTAEVCSAATDLLGIEIVPGVSTR